MYNIVYIIIREDNQSFIGAYGTLVEAEQWAKILRVPTEILHWKVTQESLPA